MGVCKRCLLMLVQEKGSLSQQPAPHERPSLRKQLHKRQAFNKAAAATTALLGGPHKSLRMHFCLY